MTSSDVILPPGPVPVSVWRSIPFSFATRFAFGDASIRPLLVTGMEPWIALTSSEVIRPLGPEPETCWRSIPFSLATLFAFGDARIRSELGDFSGSC